MFSDKILQKIKDSLIKKGQTIAAAESVTAGFLQAAFASATDAMQFFQGGITAYNLGQKCRHLSIDPIHADECDCVSDIVAATMALNVCNLFCSDWGIGITGFASPVPESGNKLFAHYAIVFKGKVVAQKRVASPKEPGADTQLFFVEEVLKGLVKTVRK